MKFYNRDKELQLLHDWEELSAEAAQMTIVIGRRRVGKTTLIKKAFENKKMIYFFCTKKNEALLCEEFVAIAKDILGTDILEYRNFRDLFRYLMRISTEQNFTLVIDEFQEFYYINPAIYSEMQNVWDEMKDHAKINLVLCGSIYSLMKRIFENSREPLFQRADHRIVLRPFTVDVIKDIIRDHFPSFTPEDLLAFYTVTGGVARYIELLIKSKAFTKEKILDTIFSENSFFLEEGKNVLIEEFGKDYTVYFSILSLIASSKTSRPEIEGELGVSVGPQLKTLEEDFNVITRTSPIFSKPNTRQIRYYIDDNFLNFWFRFIYKYRSAVEISNLGFIRQVVERDYNTYIGRILEKYFRDQLILSKEWSAIGSYWENGNKNEIDIVAVDEFNKRMVIGKVKHNPNEINLGTLEYKAKNIAASHKKYTIEYKGFSPDDM